MIASSELKIDELRRNAIEQAFLKTLETIKSAVNGQGPSCFISHAWKGSEPGEESGFDLFALKLKDYLIQAGIYAFYDEKSLKEGQHTVPFMNKIGHSRFILILFTKDYKDKSEFSNTGIYQEVKKIEERLGVGDEFYIPILLSGEEGDSIPGCLDPAGRNYEDFRELDKFYSQFFKLLRKTFFHNLENVNINATIKLFKDIENEYLQGQHDGDLIEVWKKETKESQKRVLEKSKEREKFHKIIITEQIKDSSYRDTQSNKSLIQKIFWMRKRKTYLLILILLVIFCPGFVVYMFIKQIEIQKTHSIRSELIIPVETAFLDRPELIQKINEKVNKEKGINSLALIGVVGMGGAGKTTLVRQYGRMQKETIVWEINAETKRSLMNSLESLGNALTKTQEQKQEYIMIKNIQNPEEKNKQLLEFLKQHLKENVNWLLIFDNVTDFSMIKDYLPHDPAIWGPGRIILTTRDSNIQNTEYIKTCNIIKIDTLTSHEALILFSKILFDKPPETLTQEQKNKTLKFLKKIPPFPLDVSVTARYIKNAGMTYEQYLKTIINYTKDFEKTQINLLKEASNYTKTRHIIISLSVEKIIKEHQNFKELLVLVSLINSQDIPIDLLKQDKDPSLVESFIYELKKFSLATIEISTPLNPIPTISLHRNIQEIMLVYLTEYLKLKKNNPIIEHILDIFSKYVQKLIDSEDFERTKLFVQHLKSLLKNHNLLSDRNIGLLYGDLGRINLLHEYHTNSEQYYLKSLNFLKKNRKENLYFIGKNLMFLGNIYRILMKYDQAKQALEESLFIYKKYFPKKHGEIGEILTYLATMYGEGGFGKKSFLIFQEAFTLFQKNDSNNYPKIALLLSYAGNRMREYGDYQTAKDFLEESLQIYTKFYPKRVSRVSWVLESLGNTYRNIGDYKKSISNLQKSIHILGERYGDRLPWPIIHLGNTYQKIGQYKTSLDLMEKGITVYKKYEYPAAWPLVRLGSLYRDIGRINDSKNSIEEGLKIYKKMFKNDNKDIAWALIYLGQTYLVLKNYKEAKKVTEKGILILRDYYKENHPKMAWGFFCLSNIETRLGNLVQAEALLRKAYNIYKKHYGPNHIETSRILRSFGYLYLMQGDFLKAEHFFKKSLEIFEEKNHPDAYILLEDLAELTFKHSVYSYQENDINTGNAFRKESIKYFNKAIIIVKDQLPLPSPHMERLKKNRLKCIQLGPTLKCFPFDITQTL